MKRLLAHVSSVALFLATPSAFAAQGSSLAPGVPIGGAVDTNTVLGRTNAARAADFANVLDYGADRTGAQDSTNAVSNACATGRKVYMPSGTYLVSNLACTLASGQSLEGDTDGLTILKVPATFNLNALGVIRISPAQPAGVVRNIAFIFAQPDTTTRSNLTAYPPAIYLEGAPRARIEHVRCIAAMTCVDAKGNTGGLLVNDFQSSAFNISVDLDGALDTVRLDDLHLWPFGLTTNQTTILADPNTYGVKSGRVDGLEVSGFLTYNIRNALSLYKSASSSYSPGGHTFGTGVNMQFDSASTFSCKGDGATFNMTSGYWTFGVANVQAAAIDGCNVNLNSFNFFQAAASTNPIVALADTTGTTRFTIGNSFFNMGSYDLTAISAVQNTNQIYADIGTTNFFRGANNAYTYPTVGVTGTAFRGSLHDLTASDVGTGSGTFLSVGSDGFYSIYGIKSIGWANSFPSSITQATINLGPGTAANNYAAGNDSRIVGAVQTSSPGYLNSLTVQGSRYTTAGDKAYVYFGDTGSPIFATFGGGLTFGNYSGSFTWIDHNNVTVMALNETSGLSINYPLSTTSGTFSGPLSVSDTVGFSAAGTTLATAAAAATDLVFVSTASSSANGVLVRAFAGVAGRVNRQEITNVSGTTINLWPPTASAQIWPLNGSTAAGAAGAAVTLANGSHATLECVSAILCYEAP